MKSQSNRENAAHALQLAASLFSRGNPSAAEASLLQLLQRAPGCGPAWDMLSVICNAAGRPNEAVGHAQSALAIEPQRAEFHYTHGRALRSMQRLDEAVAAYERALKLKPKYPEALVSMGIVAQMQGRWDEAVAQYRRALRFRPEFPEALTNLGNALAERIGSRTGERVTAEDLREAEHLQRRALALSPNDPKPLHNLGLLLKLTGRYEEALPLFNRALAIDGSRADTCLQFGDLLCKEARFDLARQLYTRWLGQQPPHPVVMLQLADALFELGESTEALDWVDRAEALKPDMPESRYLKGRILQQTFSTDMDIRATLASFDSAISARPDYAEAVCAYLMTLCYVEEDASKLFVTHQTRLAPVAVSQRPASTPTWSPPVGRRIRIGYVSSDWKRHSVAYFLEGILESHDRSRFEVHAYKSNASSDPVTQRLRRLCDGWNECSHLSDEQLADRVRADGIDVLIDLSGLTSGNRLGVFQRRAAPCQLTYLGYPASTGARCFDFRLTDAVIDPAGAECVNSEALLRLPQTMFCYRRDEAPDVSDLPALTRAEITFCSFNNLAKVGPRTLGLWVAALQAVPNSRLFLKAAALTQHGNREFIRRHFASFGIDPDRITLQPFSRSVQEHLSLYREVDIGLDSFPFNGATTTCEALLMGVPVITLAGLTQPSRMGASILRAVGLSQFVAKHEAHYAALASSLAADLSRLAELRGTMRDRLMGSRLWNRSGFTIDFEALLEAALTDVLSRDRVLRPESF